jgi:hypothetical protein
MHRPLALAAAAAAMLAGLPIAAADDPPAPAAPSDQPTAPADAPAPTEPTPPADPAPNEPTAPADPAPTDPTTGSSMTDRGPGEPAAARADEPAAPSDEPATDPRFPVSDQELGVRLGFAGGGGVTPGGFRIAGLYLYQLAEADWFEGSLGFTFGGGGAACFRDRQDDFLCEHGVVDGFGGELGFGVRRFFPGNGGFLPYARAALGARIAGFRGDDVTGFAIPLIGGGGVRVRINDILAVGGDAALELGPSWFSDDVGAKLQLGLAVAVTADFALP